MRLMRAEPDAVDRVATEVEFQVTLDREFDGLRERSEHAQARFEQEIRDNVVHLLHDRVRHHQVEIMDIHASAPIAGADDQDFVGTVIKIAFRDLPHEDVSEIRQLIGGGVALAAYPQRDAFRPPANEKQWKVVLATNVAETSVTIPDVSFVIDAGLEKIVKYDDHLGAFPSRN